MPIKLILIIFERDMLLNKKTIEYPAVITVKNSLFIANCVLFNLSVIGRTEKNAVQKLADIMTKQLPEFNIIIKPVYMNKSANSV